MNYEIFIFSEIQNNRTDYIFNYLFSELLGLKMHTSGNPEDANSFEGPVIYYTDREIPGKLCICPAGLLSDTGYKNQNMVTGVWDGLMILFAGIQSHPIPFDIFSASFYMMSRYEEYLDYQPDIYGRFPAGESMAFRAGFLDLPVVNLWTIKLAEVLRSYYPGLKTKKNRFHWLASIDVDRAWAFLNKGYYRTWGGLAASLLRGKDFNKRIKVLRHEEADPFLTFDDIRGIHREFPEKLLLFFQSGRPGHYDLNESPRNPEWRTLVSKLGGEYQIGIHPSYHSNTRFQVLKNEFDTLSELLPYPLKNSRQHFLKLKFPHTYRNLIQLGIQNDFTMGYPDLPGFRAGLCTPFNFYDLAKEEKTPLKVWPITLMDRTLKDYLHKIPEDSMDIIHTYMNIVEKAGGWFIPIWHNDTLSDYGEWEGWKNLYIQMIETLKSKS